MSVTKLENWLDAYLNFEKLPQKNIFWLDTMQFLCRQFGNPERSIPAVHIAGSKGKGSVSAMICSILTEAKLAVGLYTSPHIVDFTERVRTAHGAFPVSVYDRAVEELISGVERIPNTKLPGRRPITWFELVTLFAFLCFRQASVDWGIYEVGLGGRLDATNVLFPKLCAITPIELEHTQYLGNTIEKIASEKAGIIKDSVPVVVSTQSPSVRDVFTKVSQLHRSEICFVDDFLTANTFSYNKKEETNQYGMMICLDSPLFNRSVKTRLKMLGEFQVQNAALAAFTVKKMYPDIDESVIERGLARASLPGRFEILDKRANRCSIPILVLDGAHTVNSIRYTLSTFSALFNMEAAHLLFACAADKDVEHIAPVFRHLFTKIMVTRPGNVKQSNPESVKKAFSDAGFDFIFENDYSHAIQVSLSAAAKESVPLLVTGSFYLVAEVKRIIGVC